MEKRIDFFLENIFQFLFQIQYDIDRVDYIEASNEIVTAFYEKKRRLAEAGKKGRVGFSYPDNVVIF